MTTSIHHQELIGFLPISELDIMRLFIEFAEEAGVIHSCRRDIISSYRRIIRAGINSVRAAEQTVPFLQAVQASLEARTHRRPSTRADLRSFTNRMINHNNWGTIPLRAISNIQCQEMLAEQFGHSAHVFRKARTILHSVFSYGQRQGWCTINPVEGIESPPVHEQRIEILTARQIRALMRATEAPDLCSMAPAIRLMLWCGIRPGEVRRLHWRDIDSQEGVVYIESHASKTGGARAVPLRGGAAKLRNHQMPDNALIAPLNWTRLWQRLRNRAGLKEWQRDVLRHTFASFHLKHFHNLIQLQEEMGHRDSTLLRTRYLNLRNLSASTAKRFFQH